MHTRAATAQWSPVPPSANPAQVEQYRSGNAKVLQFLVGQTMKLSRGKANPQLVIAELRKQLAK